MNDRASIYRCIRQIAEHKDGRGPWQAVAALQTRLVRGGCDAGLAARVALAAQRVGEQIRKTANGGAA